MAFVPVTIASGASLSGVVSIPHNHKITAIQMPDTWTAAGLSFQAAEQDGGTYANVYDPASNAEITIAAVSASRTYPLDAYQDGLAFNRLKIRSGTSGTPVTQGGDRILLVHFTKRT